tara:strand:+ start:347 stop:589 length:243 start_codon:yes stop_codon:yes gene_type:complete
MVSQYNKTLTLTEQMKYNSQLHEKLKRCERKIILLHKEQTNLWKRIAESVGELRVMCEHEWIRDNEPYSQLECEICGISK